MTVFERNDGFRCFGMFAYFSSVLCIIPGVLLFLGWVAGVAVRVCGSRVVAGLQGCGWRVVAGSGWHGFPAGGWRVAVVCSPGSLIAVRVVGGRLLPGSMFPWLLDSLVWCSLDWRAVDCMAVVIGCSRFWLAAVPWFRLDCLALDSVVVGG